MRILAVAAFLVLLAGCTGAGIKTTASKTAGPNISFARHDATEGKGGTLTVVSIHGGPVAWTDVGVDSSSGANADGNSGNTCNLSKTHPNGDVTAGDAFSCTGDGPFTVYLKPSRAAIYMVQFHT